MSDRKKDHIELALNLDKLGHDSRFSYEPMLSALKDSESQNEFWSVGSKKMSFPLWISSMTGGTTQAGTINKNLALAAHDFGLGFALGSCRKILGSDQDLQDFDHRETLGDQVPFYGNIGIAQLEIMILKENIDPLIKLEKKLDLDGWVVHINPMQEIAQFEGDRWTQAPIVTIKKFIDLYQGNIIVKEVGQGFGPQSLWELAQLPLVAIESAGFGGTNFTHIEQARQNVADSAKKDYLKDLAKIGHTNAQMLEFISKWPDNFTPKALIIFSGGLANVLDGYYFMSQCKHPSIYGQAGELLKRAVIGSKEVSQYIQGQKEVYQFAKSFLKVL